ncbi:hypothetical protein [Dankookia sp. P2]|uniref:hypothetical protein n=1 Tax=Dankookia sp. P2 TaxID=3423955 RepID=UPI003D664280
MRDGLHDTEWDCIPGGYDRAAADSALVATAPRIGNRKLRHWVVLALVALLVPMPNPLLCEDGASRGIPREAMFSFSPVEILLPPVDVSLARLSAESASASCWVQQLRPQGPGCAEPAAAR